MSGICIKSTEDTEEMGLPAEGSGTRGRGRPYVKEFLPGGGSGSATLQIEDVGDIYTHWEDAGWTSPPGDTPTDGVSAKTASGKKLVLPLTGDSNDRFGIGGGGYICRSPPEQNHRVHRDRNHNGYVSSVRAAPWGVGVPEVVGTGEPRPVGDAGVRKGGRDEGGGGRGREGLLRHMDMMWRIMH